jgi:hypothetical protein
VELDEKDLKDLDEIIGQALFEEAVRVYGDDLTHRLQSGG